MKPFWDARIFVGDESLIFILWDACLAVFNEVFLKKYSHRIHGPGIFACIWLIFITTVGKFAIVPWIRQGILGQLLYDFGRIPTPNTAPDPPYLDVPLEV